MNKLYIIPITKQCLIRILYNYSQGHLDIQMFRLPLYLDIQVRRIHYPAIHYSLKDLQFHSIENHFQTMIIINVCQESLKNPFSKLLHLSDHFEVLVPFLINHGKFLLKRYIFKKPYQKSQKKFTKWVETYIYGYL